MSSASSSSFQIPGVPSAGAARRERKPAKLADAEESSGVEDGCMALSLVPRRPGHEPNFSGTWFAVPLQNTRVRRPGMELYFGATDSMGFLLLIGLLIGLLLVRRGNFLAVVNDFGGGP